MYIPIARQKKRWALEDPSATALGHRDSPCSLSSFGESHCDREEVEGGGRQGNQQEVLSSEGCERARVVLAVTVLIAYVLIHPSFPSRSHAGEGGNQEMAVIMLRLFENSIVVKLRKQFFTSNKTLTFV